MHRCITNAEDTCLDIYAFCYDIDAIVILFTTTLTGTIKIPPRMPPEIKGTSVTQNSAQQAPDNNMARTGEDKTIDPV